MAKQRYIESHKDLMLARHISTTIPKRAGKTTQTVSKVVYAGGAKDRRCLGILETGRPCPTVFYSLGSHHRFCERCVHKLKSKGRMAEWCVELPEAIRRAR